MFDQKHSSGEKKIGRETLRGKEVGLQYKAMPIDQLRRWEKARDATIGFLLKQIEHAEEGQKMVAMGDDDDAGVEKQDRSEQQRADGEIRDTGSTVPDKKPGPD